MAKNILWKVPVPGWSLSHPIVVGKRVFAVGEPDFVTCWDADTGKQLWQRRMIPLLLDGMPEAKAEAGQKVLDLARALFIVSSPWPQIGNGANSLFDATMEKDGSPTKSLDEATFVAKKREVAAKLVRMVEKHRPEVEAFGDADLLAAADQDLAILKAVAAAKDMATLEPLVQKGCKRSLNLKSACAKKLGVPIGGCWWGYVGTADSTLASDGKRIFGVFDQGQVFALDLDGRLLWGHLEQSEKKSKWRYDNRGSFHRSPLLCGDLLLVRSSLFQPENRPIRALDTRTGQCRWEARVNGTNYTVPRLMRLPVPDGKMVDILISDAPEDKAGGKGQQVLRVSDGRSLGHLPCHECGRGAVMAVLGDQVTWTSASDTGGGPSCSYRLKFTGADAVAAEQVFVLGETEKKDRIFYNQHDFPTVAGKAWLYGNKLFDATTGNPVGNIPAERFSCAVVAGRYLIAPADAGLANEPYGRPRDDRKAMLRYVVVDLSDPAKPKVVSSRNLLGYADPPPDLIIKNYLSEFDPYEFAGCYKGSQSFFAMMSGPVPHGNRLYIQSSAYLYCIAPDVEGRNGDDPASTARATQAGGPAAGRWPGSRQACPRSCRSRQCRSRAPAAGSGSSWCRTPVQGPVPRQPRCTGSRTRPPTPKSGWMWRGTHTIRHANDGIPGAPWRSSQVQPTQFKLDGSLSLV
jgi:hypothetical protein